MSQSHEEITGIVESKTCKKDGPQAGVYNYSGTAGYHVTV